MRETREREREKRKENAELVSVYVTQKACAHALNFVRSATKRAGVNQQPPMHQFRMSPLKPFSG
jgi:uncharacterized Fe-S cluster protein YjdI